MQIPIFNPEALKMGPWAFNENALGNDQHEQRMYLVIICMNTHLGNFVKEIPEIQNIQLAQQQHGLYSIIFLFSEFAFSYNFAFLRKILRIRIFQNLVAI